MKPRVFLSAIAFGKRDFVHDYGKTVAGKALKLCPAVLRYAAAYHMDAILRGIFPVVAKRND